MKREEFIKYADQEINNIFNGPKNRIMSLVERAWAEGKRNAEIDSVTSIMKDVLKELNAEKDDKSSNLYHLYCEKCGYDWWCENPFPDECPNCKRNFSASSSIQKAGDNSTK